MTKSFICAICGSETGRGPYQHPVCEDCRVNKNKYQHWLKQLQLVHPELYDVYKV